MFVKFEKWDRALVKLMTGVSLDLWKSKSGGSLDNDVWDELVRLRQDAANKLLVDAKTTGDSAEPSSAKPKAKVEKATSRQMVLLPEVVDVTCKSHTISMLLKGLGTQSIYLELTPENLEWLRNATDAATCKEKKTRKQNEKGTKRKMPPSEDDVPESRKDLQCFWQGLISQMIFLIRSEF